MVRQSGTRSDGGSFDHATINAVWEKAQVVPTHDKNVYRKDRCGAWIAKASHGNTSSQYGWEIDHIKPVSKGGTDDLSNLQPLHWKNNRGKGDNYPNWNCTVP